MIMCINYLEILKMKEQIISSIILLILDIVWLNLVMKKRYGRMIPQIQGSKMALNYYYATLSYAFMIIGLNVFVIPHIDKKNLITSSLKFGFTFGLILYGVYDFTAGAVLTNWDFRLALLDILWGGVVFFLTCVLTFKISGLFPDAPK